jgi:hypothetical protein
MVVAPKGPKVFRDPIPGPMMVVTIGAMKDKIFSGRTKTIREGTGISGSELEVKR